MITTVLMNITAKPTKILAHFSVFLENVAGSKAVITDPTFCHEHMVRVGRAYGRGWPWTPKVLHEPAMP
jgi:hypothetical protein